MAYTIVFRKKHGFSLFCCHSIFFGYPYRCAVKRFRNCLDHCGIPRPTCLTSLRDWICPKKFYCRHPNQLNHPRFHGYIQRSHQGDLDVLVSFQQVFTLLAEVILDAIFVYISPRDVLAKILAAERARATRDGTTCSKNRNFVPYHRGKARSRAYGLLPLWLLFPSTPGQSSSKNQMKRKTLSVSMELR